jgi:hypothetical protein
MRKSVTMGLMAGVLGMGLATAQVKLDDKLSLSGFLDMSATAGMPDAGPKTLTASFDQFELDFNYKFADNLAARADVNSLGGGAVVLEQAYLTYTMGSASIMTGKFLSVSGFEAAEPTGLYQYSTSKTLVYGGYQNGFAASYTVSPMISLYGSVVGSVWNGTDTDIKKPGIEAQVSLLPLEGVTVKAAYLFESEYAGTWDSAGTPVAYVTDRSLINVWGQYIAGPLTVAAELNMLMKWDENENSGLGYLAMVNYKLNDKLGVTGRYSALSMDGGTADNEITVSPGYAVSSAWFVLAEVKQEIEAKKTSFAVESILTF